MSRVNKNSKLNMLEAYWHRETGMSNRQNITQELLATAEDRLVTKEHDELSCEMPGIPRSTFLMVFSPDGTKVASTHGNHNVYVTDLRTGKHCNTLVGHPRTPWCIAFHPSSNQILATGCLGGQVRIWDLSGGSEVWTTDCQTVIASLAFHPHDRLLVIATYNVLYFWDWSQPKPFMQTCTNNAKEKVRYVAFDRLGHKLITGIANMQASGTRICERSRGSHPLFSQSSPITRMPQPDIYLVRQNAHAWYPRRGNRPPRPYVCPGQNDTNSNNSRNANNNNNANQNESENSTSDYERRIIQLYESLMQRFLEVYRTRATSTMDRGTDPMEPIPLNSALSSQTSTTNTGPVTTSIKHLTKKSTTNAPSSPTANISPEGVPATSTPNCESPQAGPSGIQTAKKRPRPKRNKRVAVIRSDDDSSSSCPSSSSDDSDEPPVVLKRRIKLASALPSTSSSSLDPQQPSTSKNITKSKKSRKDRKPKYKKVLKTKDTRNKFCVSKSSAFHPTDSFLIQDDDDEPEGDVQRPVETPEESSSTTTVNVPDVSFQLELSQSNIEPTTVDTATDLSTIPVNDDDDAHFISGVNQWMSRSTDDDSLNYPRSFPDLSTSNSNAQLPRPNREGTPELFDIYSEDGPVDLSANGYSVDDDSTRRPVDPTVDHNYMASSSSAEPPTPSLPPTPPRGPTEIPSRFETRQRLLRQMDLRPDERARNEGRERARAEGRQLQFIRYMCHKFQELLCTSSSSSNSNEQQSRGAGEDDGQSPAASTTNQQESTENTPTTTTGTTPATSSPRRRNSYPRCVTFRLGNDDIIPPFAEASTSSPNSPLIPSNSTNERLESFDNIEPRNDQNSPPASPTFDERSATFENRPSNENANTPPSLPPKRLQVHRLTRHILLPRMHSGCSYNLQNSSSNREQGSSSEPRPESSENNPESRNDRNNLPPRRYQVPRFHRHIILPRMHLPTTDLNRAANSNATTQDSSSDPCAVNLSRDDTVENSATPSTSRNPTNPIMITEAIRRLQGNSTNRNSAHRNNNFSSNNSRRNSNSSSISSMMWRRNEGESSSSSSLNQVNPPTLDNENPTTSRHENIENLVQRRPGGANESNPSQAINNSPASPTNSYTESHNMDSSTRPKETKSETNNQSGDRQAPSLPPPRSNYHLRKIDFDAKRMIPPYRRGTAKPQSTGNEGGPCCSSTQSERSETNDGQNSDESWLRTNNVRKFICLAKTHLNKPSNRRSSTQQQPHCLRNNTRLVHSLRRQRSVPPLSSSLSHRRVFNPRHRMFYATTSQSPRQDGSENNNSGSASSSSSTSTSDQSDINENMVITPASVLTIVSRLEDLIRQQYNQPQVRFYRLTNSSTTRTERHIHLRLLSIHNRLQRMGIRLDHRISPHFLEDKITGIGGGDIENVFRCRHTLSIILVILMRYYENHHQTLPPNPRILTERLSSMLRLCSILTDTLLLNVLERLPSPDMRDTHEYIVSRFRAIHERIDALHERQRNLQNSDRNNRLGNYYIEDLSRMTVNDDPNEIEPPELNNIVPEIPIEPPPRPMDHLMRTHMENMRGAMTFRHLLPTTASTLASHSQETLLSSIQEARSRFVEHAITRARILRRRVNNELSWRAGLVPQVQVNDVPINDDPVLNRPVRPMPLPQQRISTGMFRPRFLHPLYGGGVLVDGDIDDPQREQIFGMDADFPASACPNHRIQIWNMSDGRIPSITNPDKNVVVSDCKIHNDASVDISQDGNLLVTLLPSGGYLNITNKLGVFSIQWDNLGQCLYTASFEQNAVSVSLSATARYLAVGLASRRVSSLVPGSERCIMAQLYKLENDGRTLLARDIEKSRNLGTTSINCIRWSPVPGQGLVYATNSGHLKVLT